MWQNRVGLHDLVSLGAGPARQRAAAVGALRTGFPVISSLMSWVVTRHERESLRRLTCSAGDADEPTNRWD